jgi:lysophospholipase L1-like esterase
MEYLNVFWDSGLMRDKGLYPSILAIGDSWFWYPFPGGSLLNRLGPMVAPREHVILAYGYNGAEAFDYVYGTFAKQVRTALGLYGSSLSAVFISGGGNDFAGLNDLRPMLLEDCSACRTPAACFRNRTEFGSMGWLLSKLEQSYAALIDQILGATWRTATGATRIILHNYDYAPVTGVGLFGPHSSPWLQPSFAAARVAPDLRDGCVKLLIDAFTTTLGGIAARYPGRVFVVDSRRALQRGDWANELHPTPRGFDKIAARWLPVLRAQGLAD